MSTPRAMTEAVEALRRLPGVGVKSASRMLVHLLQHDTAGALEIARTLQAAVHHLHHCRLCHTFTDEAVCSTCADPSRDRSRLCVVETPADQAAMERAGAFKGLYFVLMGKLSPLDGVGPEKIGVNALLQRLAPEASDTPDTSDTPSTPITEVILATSFTAEGEVTAHFLTQAIKARGIAVSRLARGIPIGSELEYVDLGTIAHAFVDRR